jgi:hypothetical protein
MTRVPFYRGASRTKSYSGKDTPPTWELKKGSVTKSGTFGDGAKTPVGEGEGTDDGTDDGTDNGTDNATDNGEGDATMLTRTSPSLAPNAALMKPILRARQLMGF